MRIDALQQAYSLYDSTTQTLKALKAIKASLVGNRRRKLSLALDTIQLQRILQIVTSSQDLSECREALNIISLLAIPNEKVYDNLLLVNLHIILWSILRDCLSVRTALLLDVLKTLRAFHMGIAKLIGPKALGISLTPLLQQPTASVKVYEAINHAFESENLPYLTRFLLSATVSSSKSNSSQLPVHQSEACILLCDLISAAICEDYHQEKILFLLGSNDYLVLESLVALLELDQVKLSEAILNAVAVLVRANGQAASRIQLTLSPRHKLAVELILEYLSDAKDTLRLAATLCATNLFKAVDAEREPLLHMMPSGNVRNVLLALLRLLSADRQTSTMAAFTLAYLVYDDTELSSAACQIGAMSKLEGMLKTNMSIKYEPYISEAQIAEVALLKEAVLVAVASLSLESDNTRRQVIEANLLGHIVSCLSDDSPGVRAAACGCARALSRSVTILRTHLIDAGAARPLFNLLSDAQPDMVKITAIATCSNLLIEFSPMKEVLLECSVLPRLTELSHSSNLQLRLHALIAIKNVAYWSDSKLKRILMDHLTWNYLLMQVLAQVADSETQAQALGIIRNTVATKVPDIEWGIDGIGSLKLLELIEEKLSSPLDDVALQTLHIILNIAGSHRGRELLYSRTSVMNLLLAQLSHSNQEIRLTAVWSTAALARREPTQRHTNDNALRLRSLGFESRLREMRDDAALDIRERARDTLLLLDTASFRVD